MNESPLTGTFLIFRDFEARAKTRPCTAAMLFALDQELTGHIAAYRHDREKRREAEAIEAEPLELRQAMHSARRAVRNAMSTHSSARAEVERLKELIKRGHVQEAATQRSELQKITYFPDLNLDFVTSAVEQREARKRWMLTMAMLLVTGILVAATIIEVLMRSASK